MPIYEYQCAQCGERFEVRQSLGEGGSGLNCPKCHAQNPKRLFSSFFSPGSGTSELSGTGCPTCNSGVCGLPPME
ncbi:MAG: zinc ribbon domain-containing protein [Chloroflexi bacterium CG08_land_8_20_14_0_20_45_12]|nr:MAG: FmdB family transcriptional regulator [Syntrophobacterales bacterium CG23_combo_of_CG06-09_8_20_14_all_48_27]PIU23611.1 MAG: zinc ribbon domain-containing protein [Chloroflexi bacterium CG08_land_8_20_14_0_20_45_12]